MGSKYIKNTDNATLVCKIPSDKNKSFVFPVKKFDKRNGVLAHNGITEISDEDLALLRNESKAFKYYENNASLSVMDNLPYESMSAEQLISTLKAENAALKKMMKEAQHGDAEALSLLEAKVVEQNNRIKYLEKQLEEKETIIKALDLQLAEKSKKAEKSEKDKKEKES